MSYFTWKEAGLTSDCETLESMASRFEEAAKLMRKMSEKGVPEKGPKLIFPDASDKN